MAKKFIINSILIIGIFAIIIWLVVQTYQENKINEKTFGNYNNENINITIVKQKNTLKETKQYEKEEIISQFKGQPVIAKLYIPEINLETYILKEYSEKALNLSVTKFWGSDPNKEGNFCVAGHNFQNDNMFYNLKNLNLGDKIFVSDSNVGKVEYEIYDLYKVQPNDISCLSQNTNGRKEITLITCTNNSEKRIIVKAKESNSQLQSI